MMTNRKINIGDALHGFTVTRVVPLTELGADLIQMTHEKTALELVWIRREEENKTFAISFETLPEDDTGVFHILEHSVLCGSDRYPVKEPFVELLKNSLNTFLNAMTFPDKTMYPVSSKNNQDFLNLMRVYLDAVFHPAIYHNPAIFMQEGWHYERDENGQVTYKGVVFNEMKGALADPAEIMEVALNRSLFPDTAYAYISGGDPECIPDLTYEGFLAAHTKYYSPTNGIVFLDGDLDIDQVLSIIDGEFLADLPKGVKASPPAVQQPVDGGVTLVPYEIGPDEPAEQRMRMAWGRGLGRFDEREKLVAMDILAEVLAGNNEAYLTRPILQEGLAEDVILRAYDGIAQPWVKLEVRNYNKKDQQRIEEILHEQLVKLAEEGLDHERLEAVMANQEFLMGERDFGTYPQGLFFSFLVMDSMLYGGNPEVNLEKRDLFDRLRTKMEEGYFEELIRTILLENDHCCQVILEPSETAGEERRAREEARIAAEQEAWTEETEARIAQDQQALQEWQSSEDAPEDLAKLPHLTLEDLDEKPEQIPTEVKEVPGAVVLRHNVESGDVRYVSLYFEIGKYDLESLPALSFLAELVGVLPTGTKDGQQLIMEEQRLLGRLDLDLLVFGRNNSKDISSIQFVVSFSALESKLEQAIDLVTKILTDTRFEQTQLILEHLKQCRQDKMRGFLMSGHSAAIRRIMAMASRAGVAQESITGHAYYQWMVEREEHWDPDGIRKELEQAMAQVLRPAKLTVSVTGGKNFDESPAVQQLLGGLEKALVVCPEEAGQGNVPAPNGFRKEGIQIPADIAFTACGGDLALAGSEFSGHMQVAARIISLAYLWNVIRVQGGAYGTGMSVHPAGILTCYSFRDPSGAASLDVFRQCAGFLRELAAEELDLTGFIIGAVSEASPLLTPRLKAVIGDSFYLRGVTYEERCRIRKELLTTTPDMLVSLADAIEKTLQSGGQCIVSSQEQVAAAEPDVTLTI